MAPPSVFGNSIQSNPHWHASTEVPPAISVISLGKTQAPPQTCISNDLVGSNSCTVQVYNVGHWHLYLTFGGWGVYFLHPESFYFRVNYYFQWTRDHSIRRAGIIFMEFNWNSQCISIFLTTVPWQSVWSTCTYNSSWECEYSLTLFRPPDILGFKLKYCKLKRKQSFKNPRSTCT